jgi:hypothetical protein
LLLIDITQIEDCHTAFRWLEWVCAQDTVSQSSGIRNNSTRTFATNQRTEHLPFPSGPMRVEFGNQVLISSHRKLLWSKDTMG